MAETIKTCDAVGWLFVTPSAIPEEWQSRAIPVALIPLLAPELKSMLTPSAEPTNGPSRDEAALLAMLGQGMDKQRMARALHISMRTLDRRLHVLREKFGVTSLTELAATVARRGFGEPGRPGSEPDSADPSDRPL